MPETPELNPGRRCKRDLMAEPMAFGETLNDKGFVYVCESWRPHTTKNGEASLIVSWRAQCAECGVMFSFTTGSKIWNLPRRCPTHARDKGWSAVKPWNPADPVAAVFLRPTTDVGAGLAADSAMNAEVTKRLFALRKRCLEVGSELDAAAVTLVRGLYSAWVNDPDTMAAADESEEKFLYDSTANLIEAAAKFEWPAPLSADDLI